jgi:hypothetical protein
MPELPPTTVECDAPGCKDELHLLAPHLTVAVKPKQKRLVVEEVPPENPNEIAVDNMYLGNRSGRGPKKGVLLFHDFKCAAKWFEARKDKTVKLEVHEEDEIYEPEDNRTPEQLVKAGEMPDAWLKAQRALANRGPGGEG